MTAIDDNQRLVAILRGILTDEVDSLVGALIDSGFTAIEIPLNSPTPFDSITRAAELSRERGGPERHRGRHCADSRRCRSGEGLRRKSGRLAECRPRGDCPRAGTWHVGYARRDDPTEAFAAIDAGARDLKLFPASLLGPDGIKAIRAVLPDDVRIYAVGGVGADDFAAYTAAGVYGFDLAAACSSRALTPEPSAPPPMPAWPR